MEKLTSKLAAFIGGQLGFDEERIKVTAYGLSALSQALLLFAIALAAGLALSHPAEFMIAFFSVGLLRRFIGGAHMKTYAGCIVLSSLMIACIGLLSGIFAPTLHRAVLASAEAALYLFCFLSTAKFAPLDSPNKRITSPEKIKRLKRGGLATLAVYVCLSAATLILGFPGASAALSLSGAWQCFVITPFGHNFINLINNMPTKLWKEIKS